MFQYSEIKPVDLNNVPSAKRKRSEFTEKLIALRVGEGFEVTGMTRGNVASRLTIAGKMHGRSFGSTAIDGGKVLVFRKA